MFIIDQKLTHKKYESMCSFLPWFFRSPPWRFWSWNQRQLLLLVPVEIVLVWIAVPNMFCLLNVCMNICRNEYFWIFCTHQRRHCQSIRLWIKICNPPLLIIRSFICKITKELWTFSFLFEKIYKLTKKILFKKFDLNLSWLNRQQKVRSQPFKWHSCMCARLSHIRYVGTPAHLKFPIHTAASNG